MTRNSHTLRTLRSICGLSGVPLSLMHAAAALRRLVLSAQIDCSKIRCLGRANAVWPACSMNGSSCCGQTAFRTESMGRPTFSIIFCTYGSLR